MLQHIGVSPRRDIRRLGYRYYISRFLSTRQRKSFNRDAIGVRVRHFGSLRNVPRRRHRKSGANNAQPVGLAVKR